MSSTATPGTRSPGKIPSTILDVPKKGKSLGGELAADLVRPPGEELDFTLRHRDAAVRSVWATRVVEQLMKIVDGAIRSAPDSFVGDRKSLFAYYSPWRTPRCVITGAKIACYIYSESNLALRHRNAAVGSAWGDEGQTGAHRTVVKSR